MKKNTVLRFMGELSGRYLKLVFPKIEPHKCVKKRKERTEESIEKTEQRNYVYNIILIGGAEERKEKVDERYKYSYIVKYTQ